ncbi:hypothetical protein [Thalassospira tepidiphila]|uniref:Metallohydrolase n=2 Tax=Thalassospira tepidiphila TaxID=393657 RepID=A0A853KUF6_9PROT|nr:hypothetical protein [Thalassospira tepidiphila]NJB74355.1 hypothetical protein [Thalassospira tepidiphila]OAZ07657.1 hypothetical protein TH4_20980 [Thalassospira tepidiphila MCCC 1A03514]
MAAQISFFPVGNGDMTLIRLRNDQSILIDINVTTAADDASDDRPDVISQLRERLEKDENGRSFVDVFVLSHPDQDHISGLEKHFHLGPENDWKKEDDKILIKEMWSSPIIFRRASKNHKICEDAKAWAKEARRRVAQYRETSSFPDGERIQIMGEDADGKTDDINEIVVSVGDCIETANSIRDGAFSARLLAPLSPDDQIDEEELSKNNSSVILRFALQNKENTETCHFLTGGDAGVAIWERLWELHGETKSEWLEYDILQAPHHCSWRSLSYQSWSDLGEKAQVNDNAVSALSQVLEGGIIISSSKTIKKDDANPPHERAKREYLSMVGGDADRFFCTMEHWDEKSDLIEFELVGSGIVKKTAKTARAAATAIGVGGTATHARAHGDVARSRS